jgi:hypothetical protein
LKSSTIKNSKSIAIETKKYEAFKIVFLVLNHLQVLNLLDKIV